MKQAFTRWLPLVASLLFSESATYAQAGASPQSRLRARTRVDLSTRLGLPAGAAALRHALPAPGGKLSQVVLARASWQADLSSRRAPSAVPARTTQTATTGPVNQEWVARYAGADNNNDVATHATATAAGNAYVTGYSMGNGYDYLTVGYNQGGQRWATRFDGSGSGDDFTAGIVVDAAGNVYVTGSSAGVGSGYDFATIKYSPIGRQLWVARYTGAGTSDDLAADLAIDAAGNVYVTGTSFSSARAHYDYVTVKYSPNGQLLWESRYQGPATSDNLAADLALDAAGDVLVTGTCYTASQSDYATLKYAGATGQPQWEARYNGPDNGYDLVTAVAVDATGDVAVTGTSEAGGSYDYATLKYAGASGQPVWQARYNGPSQGYDEATGLAVDAAGNVVVTGYAEQPGHGWDYATLKYAHASGQPLWEASYNGPDNGYDEATAVAVDAAGNVAVTGRSFNGRGQSDYATLKYAAADGQPLWQARYNAGSPGTPGYSGHDEATSLALDGAGNVVVTGFTTGARTFIGDDTDYATLTYASATGQRLWGPATSAGAISGRQVARDLVVDAAGNVYVTGTAMSTPATSTGDYLPNTYVTIKYAPNGQPLWQARYSGGQAVALAVDAAGNVYVTGDAPGPRGFRDITTLKYSPTGQQLWEARYEQPSSLDLDARDIAVDAAGNVVVTGVSGIGGDGSVTVKYAPSGQQLWATRDQAPGGRGMVVYALAVNATGDVVIMGYVQTERGPEYATNKYAGEDGQLLWAARYTSDGYGTATALAVDATGNVYVSGGAGARGGTTLKYAPDGQQLWAAHYQSPYELGFAAAGLAVDAAGNVYVGGSSYNTAVNTDYTTLKYSASGQPLWEARYDGEAGNSAEVATGLAVDGGGNVYVTGMSATDYATVKYSPSGAQVWAARYDGAANSRDAAVGLVVDAAGNVYVAGTSYGLQTEDDYLTVKYGPSAAPLPAGRLVAANPALALAAARGGRQALAVYPNPTAGPATVRFRPVQDGAAQVVLYNQLGQAVTTLYDGPVRQGQPYELSLTHQHLAAGLYTCALLVGGQRETVRLLVTP